MNEQYTINFTKNLGHNQMCIVPTYNHETDNPLPINVKDYRIKMICNNSISGLLNTHVQYINGIPNFCYDISGLQSLSITLESKPLDHTLLTRIIYEIYNLLFTCEKYMLDTDKLLLDPEYIFITPHNLTIKICYLPLKTTNFTASMRQLFDYFLKHIDHSDEKCVYIAYSIHNHCVSENITPNLLISYINTNENNTPNTPHDKCEQEPYYNITNTNNSPHNISTISLNEIPTPNIKQEVSDTNLKDNNILTTIFIKAAILLIVFLAGFVGAISLHIFNLIDLPLLIILILLLMGVCIFLGYNIYKNIEGPIQSITKEDTFLEKPSSFYLEDSGSTILLSSSENNDSHVLIYTGSDKSSHVNLNHYPFTIGKSSDCDLVLQNPIISRLHCRINCYIDENNSKKYYLEDLNSTNGTFLNNTPVTPYKKTNIKSGDNISFGHLTYIFR